MTKRQAERAARQLYNQGWAIRGLIEWARGDWSVGVVAEDGLTICLDELEELDVLLAEGVSLREREKRDHCRRGH